MNLTCLDTWLEMKSFYIRKARLSIGLRRAIAQGHNIGGTTWGDCRIDILVTYIIVPRGTYLWHNIIVYIVIFPTFKSGMFPTLKLGTFLTLKLGTFQTLKLGTFRTLNLGTVYNL